MTADEIREGDVERFWTLARRQARIESLPGYFGPSTLEVLAPPTWSFGATPEQADELLGLVLAGTKTATSSALRDYEGDEGALPRAGSIDIVLDSAGRPRALLKITDVEIVPFDEVDEEHARREGEGDLSLAHWREVHERFFTDAVDGEPFDGDMPVVLERFEVLYQE